MQDFYTHLEKAYEALGISIKSNEGDADLYTFYYIKYAENRKEEGLHSTNPLLEKQLLVYS